MAVLKHIASKNADYGEAQRYLMFQYDEYTGKPILDENGRLIPREEYYLDGINCNPFTFDMECKELNAQYHKNQTYDEIKSQITDGNSSLWTSIKNSISSLLGGSSQTSIEKIDISENLKNWYKETKKNGPTRKTTGKIVFGIKDGKWALISFDERLIYGYYGLRPLQ